VEYLGLLHTPFQRSSQHGFSLSLSHHAATGGKVLFCECGRKLKAKPTYLQLQGEKQKYTEEYVSLEFYF